MSSASHDGPVCPSPPTVGEFISSELGNAPQLVPESTGRYFYDLLFFVVVSVLLLNLIFGIIIDTFSSLRENANQQVTLTLALALTLTLTLT